MDLHHPTIDQFFSSESSFTVTNPSRYLNPSAENLLLPPPSLHPPAAASAARCDYIKAGGVGVNSQRCSCPSRLRRCSWAALVAAINAHTTTRRTSPARVDCRVGLVQYDAQLGLVELLVPAAQHCIWLLASSPSLPERPQQFVN